MYRHVYVQVVIQRCNAYLVLPSKYVSSAYPSDFQKGIMYLALIANQVI